MLFFPILGRKFFCQSSVRKTFSFPQVFDKNLKSIFKLNVFLPVSTGTKSIKVDQETPEL